LKVLFDNQTPFFLAHGGFQIQIEQTKAALEMQGVEVEFLRWWDPRQSADLIHYFGLPPQTHADLAHKKGTKFAITHLLSGLGARSAWKRSLQKSIIAAAFHALPATALARIGWSTWHTADAYIAVTSWEARLMIEIFRAPADRVHVIPNGVKDCFFEPQVNARGQWLVTTASIFPVKRLVETAQAAVAAQTPYWVIGQPLSESDAYYQQFAALCQQHPSVLRYDNVMHNPSELAHIYREARGFVLLSRWETQSLSALEAAASACPLLLSDLPWAHSTFGNTVSYCPVASTEQTAEYLRRFYDQAPSLSPPAKPSTWGEIGKLLKQVYEKVLSR
jgi:glycosyltransferase involved in cell wall biosynthesis